jgi:hypothetical protein
MAEMHGEIDDFYLDLTGVTPEEVELTGTTVPPGKYHAILLSVVEERESKTRCFVFKFHTLAGTCPDGIDCVHEERLYITEKTEQRVRVFIKRLGLATDDDFGKKWRGSFLPAIGKQVVIKVINDPFQAKDKDGKFMFSADGKAIMRDSSKLDFAGIWPAEDDRVKEVPHAAMVRARVQSLAQPPRQPQQQGELVGAANGHHGDPTGRDFPPARNTALFDDV